jgi:hypothetical protein
MYALRVSILKDILKSCHKRIKNKISYRGALRAPLLAVNPYLYLRKVARLK